MKYSSIRSDDPTHSTVLDGSRHVKTLLSFLLGGVLFYFYIVCPNELKSFFLEGISLIRPEIKFLTPEC